MVDWDEIKRSIARVKADVGGEPSVGTAFHIGGGLAVTALHVVADMAVGQPVVPGSGITLTFGDGPPIEATLVEGLSEAASDWAVLRCEVDPNVPPLEATTTVPRKAAWWTYGFPALTGGGSMTLDGTVTDPNGECDGVKGLQLYCDALGGQGPPLHGLSGAPCLIDGKVAGVIRATLATAVFDGRQVRRLYVQAGTVYATPASAIVAFQASRRMSKLPETWAPPSGTSQEFVVFLSSNDRRGGGLGSVASSAQKETQVRDLIGPPHAVPCLEVFKSREAFLEHISLLCQATVAVFDASGFEPAIMLLAGIRSVVRRGITILSVGGKYALGDRLDVPFNITDANIVSHSDRETAHRVLAERLLRGLKELALPNYLDNPVFESIRRIPADRRGLIPRANGVLVLCAFEADSKTKTWEKLLKPAFDQQMSYFPREPGAMLGVARSFELNSSRLVTQSLYESIRRAQACVVDLTHWSPNVMFELGVRLAASGEGTACLLAKGWKPPRPELKAQCDLLADLFVHEEGYYQPKLYWGEDKAYAAAYGPSAKLAKRGLSDGSVHVKIAAELDLTAEPAARPVYRELMDAATLFGKEPGNSKPVGLFPENPRLTQAEESAEFARLLAAWLYLFNCPPDPADADARKAGEEISVTLFERHSDRIKELRKAGGPDLQKALAALETTFTNSLG